MTKKKESSTNHKLKLEKLKGNTLVYVWVSWQNAVFSYEGKSEQQLLTMLLLGFLLVENKFEHYVRHCLQKQDKRNI